MTPASKKEESLVERGTSLCPFSMLVLRAEPDDPGSQICTGILCPVNPDPWPVVRLHGLVDAWRSIDREKVAFGLHPTFVRALGDDLDSRIRSNAYDISVFTVRGNPTDISTPYLILPYPELTPTKVNVELQLAHTSLFYLAGYQCYLWIAIMGSTIWDGAWNLPNPHEVHVARRTVFQPGDALPIFIRGQKVIAGFAVLRERVSDRVFLASLTLLGDSDWVSKGTCIMTACASEIEGIINRFETPFAWIR